MDLLRFHCVICGAALETAATLPGQLTECSSCLRIVPIPARVSFPRQEVECLPVLPRDILSVEIKILCGHCDSKIRLDARLEGQRIKCPVCAAAVEVPIWSRPPDATSTPPATPLSAAEIEFLSASVVPAA